MSGETIRIKMAEVLIGKPKETQRGTNYLYFLMDKGWLNVPNYPEDLNAVHAAVATITDKVQRAMFCDKMNMILNRDCANEFRFLGATPFHYAQASALQKCEAYLRTIGKWPLETPEEGAGE